MNLQPTIPLETSATVAINTLALQKKARGERVFNLAAGEPVLAPHQAIIAGADAAMAAGKTLYTPAAGIPELRAAASTWMNRTYQTNFEPKNTLVTCGGKFGIFALLQAYLKPGDEVAIIAPYWVSYPSMIHLSGGVPRIVETEEANGWKIKIEQLEYLANPPSRRATAGGCKSFAWPINFKN